MKILEMTVPAREEFSLPLRMAMAGVCALHDVPVDVMEDLRSAVDESCDLLLHQDFQAHCLSLTCEMTDGSLQVAISASKGCSLQAENPADADMAKLIIGSLVRKVDLEQDENGVHTVRMILPGRV
ncbi:MAG: hypothetical protein IJN44_10355 [Clostridia bacterium]|nr:hypothetical protein [Clostridia bacterium]